MWSSTLKSYLFKYPFFIVVLSGVLVRLIVMVVYNYPAFYPDSKGYIELAEKLKEYSLIGYNGLRTPGYPLIITLLRFKYELVVLFQIVLDFFTCYFVYDIIRKHNVVVSFVFSLFFISLFNVILFSLTILTESSTQFFLVLIIWIADRYEILNSNISLKLSLLLSILLAVIFFIRPMFIFVTPIVAFFKLCKLKKNMISKLVKICVILALPFLSYFGWSYLNLVNNNWYTVTTFYGFNLSQNSINIFDRVSDDHATVKDIYLKHIKIVRESGEDESMSIWSAYAELKEETNLNDVELSMYLADICKPLIKSHPKEYAVQVFKNWRLYWNSHLYFLPNNIEYPVAFKFVHILWWGQKLLLIIMHALFFIISISSLKKSWVDWKLISFPNLLLAVIYASSVLQALVTYGNNSRFSFPLFPLELIYISIVLIQLNRGGNNLLRLRIRRYLSSTKKN